MDLEEYRRIYMSMEGAANTPLNAFRRIFHLGKNITEIPKAIKEDQKIRQIKKEKRSNAMEEIKKNGVTRQGIKEVAKNLPGSQKNTRKATKRALRSTIPVVRSINELGQTSTSIIGGRANLYDGQDLERGVSFAITAYSQISRGLRLPPKMAEATLSVGHFGSVSMKYAGDVSRVKRDLQKGREIFQMPGRDEYGER